MKKKILLVDDDADLLKTVSKRLKTQGYLVRTANDGREGLETAKEELPDLIIMDVMMPYMNGLDANRLLKLDQRTADIPVIILTGLIDKEKDDQKHNKNKSYYCLAKPFEKEDLVNLIEGILNQKRQT